MGLRFARLDSRGGRLYVDLAKPYSRCYESATNLTIPLHDSGLGAKVVVFPLGCQAIHFQN